MGKAVTHQIKQLEEELEIQLFERIGNRTKLTMNGEQMLPLAYKALADADDILTFAKEGVDIRGSLTIGTCTSMMEAFMPAVITELHGRHPDIQTKIVTGTTPDSADMLTKNEVDLMMVIDERISDPYLVRSVDRAEPMDFICGKDHPLAAKKKPDLADVAEHPFIVTETGVSYTLVLERLMADRELKFEPLLETGSTTLVMDLIEKNEAVGFLPHYITEARIERGSIKKLDVKDTNVVLYDQVFRHKNKWLTPQMRAFLEILIKQYGFRDANAEYNANLIP